VSLAPPKPVPEQLIQDGLRQLIGCESAVCPPLPCGADDAWYDQLEFSKAEALAMLEAGAILVGRRNRKNVDVPNAHAFDEWYFGDRD